MSHARFTTQTNQNQVSIPLQFLPNIQPYITFLFRREILILQLTDIFKPYNSVDIISLFLGHVLQIAHDFGTKLN